MSAAACVTYLVVKGQWSWIHDKMGYQNNGPDNWNTTSLRPLLYLSWRLLLYSFNINLSCSPPNCNNAQKQCQLDSQYLQGSTRHPQHDLEMGFSSCRSRPPVAKFLLQCKQAKSSLSGPNSILFFSKWNLKFGRKVGQISVKMQSPKIPMSCDQIHFWKFYM